MKINNDKNTKHRTFCERDQLKIYECQLEWVRHLQNLCRVFKERTSLALDGPSFLQGVRELKFFVDDDRYIVKSWETRFPRYCE